MLKELHKTAGAMKELEKLSKGKCYSVAYDAIQYTTGQLMITCGVYVEDCGYFTAATWKEALKKLKKQASELSERQK